MVKATARISASPDRKKRGRPFKDDAARFDSDFLDHALQQFMVIGYRSTTMAGLASSFGSAKSTLYRKYASKARLLRAAMDRGVPALFEPLQLVPADLERAPKDVLREFGVIIQSYHADPGIRAMWRAVSEAREDLGALLDDTVEQQDRALAPIAEYLSLLKRHGRLRDIDCRAAAAAFAELVSGGLATFLGHPTPEAKRRSALNFALSLFLRGVGSTPT